MSVSEDQFTTNGKTSLDSSQEGYPTTQQVKRESSFSNSSPHVFNDRDNTNFPNVKLEPGISISKDNTHFKTNILTDIEIKIKLEKDEKSKITYELVDFLTSDSGDIKDTTSLTLKTEKVDDCYAAETRCSSSFENCYNNSDSVSSISLNATSSKDTHSQPNVRQINYDSDHVKLIDVSVTLEDLFSNEARSLGKAHSNTGSCFCIYCCGDYKYIDALHESKNLKDEKGSSLKKSRLRCNKHQTLRARDEHSSTKTSVYKNKHVISSAICRLCSAKFKYLEELKRHMKLMHDNERAFSCNLCSALFSEKATLMTHMKCVHSNKKPFRCTFCSATFKLKGNLKDHVQARHCDDKPFCCSMCSMSFKTKSTLRDHISSMHNNERPFKCNTCSATFKLKSHLAKHKTIHSSTRPFKCEICPAKFRLLQLLKEHAAVHSGERPFKCDICPATFKLGTHLAGHKHRHNAERPYKCPRCPSAFKERTTMNHHLKLVHSSNRPFKCSLCPWKSKSKGNLQDHLNSIHSNERPFKCKECPQAFKTFMRLKIHKRVHTGEKPFCCMLCGEKFSLAVNLKHHMELHSADRQFKCAHCTVSHSKKWLLQRHIQKAH